MMQLENIEYTDYPKIFKHKFIPYNSVDFNLLNKWKCDRLEFILFHDEKIKIGLIGGVKESSLLVPFSAPFSFFDFTCNDTRTEYLIKAISALNEYLYNNAFIKVKFTLPPYFYSENLISKTIFAFCQNNYYMMVDDNHFFRTKDYIKYQNNTIRKGVRYNLKVATRSEFLFKKADNILEKEVAYNIIKENKEVKNRPLRLTFEQLLNMERMICVDYFLVYLKDQPVASSIVYIYSSRIVQIIYWGDLSGFNGYYPMNFIAMNIFRYYTERGFEIIDLGNSSENSEPNFGLSNFKEIIGCTTTNKFTFIKTL
jgi:hypothetical protein